MMHSLVAVPISPLSLYSMDLPQSLQILHLKDNQLTGTIPSAFGELPFLSWLDLSNNQLVGTIAQSFGTSESIDDFRVAGNMLYDDIPLGLCTNSKINSGAVQQHGCHGVLCPAGTYSENGFASNEETCLPCPEGTTSFYLGSLTCRELSMDDFLAMLYEVMHTSFFPDDRSLDYLDENHSVCDWEGVTCDSNGEATSLMFPLDATVEDF
jgi:Leucine rich repeat